MPAPRIKRVYDEADAEDGLRILVDRLWPRGISKANARIDHWLKYVSPSDALRKRFHARPELWDEFRQAYRAELAESPALDNLRKLARHERVTLLYAARDTEHNNAVALAEILKK
ncbi:DUF488 domain-containing protein [Lysobacter niastensis]|uniref:DUF488 domain-containing protein n=1 Tax=Lysobacter niastensis TaxID=380629 RepID=A0ABS0B9W4_9GAMM|nr:DUF488 domain-containing protein [Lysobacter niastensis]MBF6025798.1 DUF488 domain-containing protein [Lysobacter niastensis]